MEIHYTLTLTNTDVTMTDGNSLVSAELYQDRCQPPFITDNIKRFSHHTKLEDTSDRRHSEHRALRRTVGSQEGAPLTQPKS